MAAVAPQPRPQPRPPVDSRNQEARKFKPKSFEDQVRYAYFTPSPQSYLPKEPGRRSENVLGKISDAKIPSALDQGAREKALVPGPGSYETPDLGDIPLPEGGRLNRKPPQEKFRLDEYPKPAPGAYGIPHDPTVPRQLYGNFGKDPRICKFIQEEVNKSKGIPAPGSHEVMDSMESLRPFCPEGGRYLEAGSRPRSYFDSAAKLKESTPGPDRYNLPGAIQKNKAHGKLVWKYQSETLAKTKQVVTKAVGGPHDNPAPGTYTLPDPAPLAPVPSLKGRQLAHAMPHPYAYNCAPDHSGKFNSLAPVREQNAGEQIFGRDFTPNRGKEGRAAKAKAIADEVVASNMPLTLVEREIEQPGETVQWRSGGFAALRKAKSAPVIEKPEHPAVAETMGHYQALSKKYGRKDKTYLPLATKRPEIVRTHTKSNEYTTLQNKKWELGALAAEIMAQTAATMEPLDEGKLRNEATKGLMDKAKFRMRMEGLAKDQQDLVLAELPGVLLESASAGPSGVGSEAVSFRDASPADASAEDVGFDPPGGVPGGL